MSSEPQELRISRLTGRIEGAVTPIVWLRGMAGAGKSRLLQAIAAAETSQRRRRILDLDAPGAGEVADLSRTIREEVTGGGGVLIASRPSSRIERILLREAAYGRILVITDGELFFQPDELAALGPEDGARLHAETGGWPLLVGAALDGRSEDTRRLLPDFLNVEGLASLPHNVVVALFAAAEAPFPPSAATELFGSLAELHPLLRVTAGGVELASSWCVEALQALKARPNLWRRATADSLVKVYARHGDPARAILALNGLGQSRMASSVYEEAGGVFMAFRQNAIAWKSVVDSFPVGLDERNESLILGRVWEALEAGRPAIALSRLEAHFPGLPVDLRSMRYAHRPKLILFRLMIEADFWGGADRGVVESWRQLDALLDQGDATARSLLMLAITDVLDQLCEREAARRRLRDWAETTQAIAPVVAGAIALRLARLSIGLGELQAARRDLETAGPGAGLSAALASLLAYEQVEAAAPDALFATFEAALDQAWPSLSFELMRASVCVRLEQDGLAAALGQLGDQAAHLRRRHCGIDERAAQLLKIRLHQMARRHAEAGDLIRGLGRPHDQGASGVEEALIRLRAQVIERRSDRAAIDKAMQAIETLALDRRSQITLSVQRAYLHHRAGEGADCRRQMAAAIRLAAADRQLAPLVEDAELIEAPLAQLLAHSSAFPQTLIEVAQAVAQRLRRVPTSPAQARETGGLSRQEHRVLDQLCDGKSNKEIARSLDITDSTVKFHLRSLFAKFGVASRKSLVDEARRRGVVR